MHEECFQFPFKFIPRTNGVLWRKQRAKEYWRIKEVKKQQFHCFTRACKTWLFFQNCMKEWKILFILLEAVMQSLRPVAAKLLGLGDIVDCNKTDYRIFNSRCNITAVEALVSVRFKKVIRYHWSIKIYSKCALMCYLKDVYHSRKLLVFVLAVFVNAVVCEIVDNFSFF